MKLFNSMTRKKEEFVPLKAGEVSMYACGPTVYNLIHIGNARPIIMFDVLRRYLEYRGNKVTFVQNFTDVDDKIINRANEEGISASQLAENYIAEYFTDAQGLGVRPANFHPKATEHMGEIIELVKTLIDKGFAYAVNGDVYYRTRKFGAYGCLSGQSVEDLESGARIDVSAIKEDPLDFTLWKAAKPGEPSWDSPWGQGRPGWHIECSAMSTRYLGKTVDIHCGGQDLQFPHHENEIAQSEAANGCKFVNYWMHNGFINIDNKKMSKSEGNFFTVREAAAVYGYEPIRFFMLSAHYRNPINYSRESLEQAQTALKRLYTAAEHLDFLMKNGEEGDMLPEEAEFVGTFEGYRSRFVDAMEDDFNTADAIGVLFDLVRAINTATEGTPTRDFAAACDRELRELTGVLGLLYNRKSDDLDSQVEALIEARQAARKSKNFAEADRIRNELKEMGIELKDTPQGVKAVKLGK
ncbi:MAG: cysteinyl-tRNA synthetase [Oscillospiraceae bacterium]|nr:cysteinyl-tRNA synthetase [Oscillospiraceae bacterium]